MKFDVRSKLMIKEKFSQIQEQNVGDYSIFNVSNTNNEAMISADNWANNQKQWKVVKNW